MALPGSFRGVALAIAQVRLSRRILGGAALERCDNRQALTECKGDIPHTPVISKCYFPTGLLLRRFHAFH